MLSPLSKLVAVTILTVVATDGWEKLSPAGDVMVWRRPVEGSRVDELRARIVIPARIERVWEVLERADEFYEFMPYVTTSRIVRRDPDGSSFEYQVVDAPVVSKRDYTVRVTVTQPASDGTWQRHWQAAPNEGPPPQKGVVRVTQIRGSWTLRDLGEQRTELTYQLLTDPAGSIPAWLARKANTESIPDLMRSVRERSLHPTWRPH